MICRETELKFSLDAATYARLRRSKHLKELTLDPVKTRHLVSTYYDTKDGRLGAAGIAWRLRREGGATVQTIKTENGHGSLARGECEAPLRGTLPDLDQVPDESLVKALRERLEGFGVEPKAKTDVRRTARRLKTESGGIVEVALDAIRFSNWTAEAAGHELELELEAGDVAGLFEIARPLVAAHRLELSLVSKAEHALHAGEAEKPSKAAHLALPASASAAEALATVLIQTMRHLTRHAAIARHGESPEAIHQLRVSLRRQRAALASFGREFGSEHLLALADRARDLATTLSAARDLDVFEAEILKPAREAVADPGAFAALAAAVADRRFDAWTRALEALNAPAYRLYLLDLAEVALRGFAPGDGKPDPASVSARELAVEILDRRLAKARGLAERFAELSIIERHDLRKELKKLRYPSEMFASLFGRGVKKYFESLAQLQDDLGSLNDVATARSLLHELVAAITARDAAAGAAAAFAAGEVAGWHVHRSQKSLKRVMKHWQRFAATEPFWRR